MIMPPREYILWSNRNGLNKEKVNWSFKAGRTMNICLIFIKVCWFGVEQELRTNKTFCSLQNLPKQEETIGLKFDYPDSCVARLLFGFVNSSRIYFFWDGIRSPVATQLKYILIILAVIRNGKDCHFLHILLNKVQSCYVTVTSDWTEIEFRKSSFACYSIKVSSSAIFYALRYI